MILHTCTSPPWTLCNLIVLALRFLPAAAWTGVTRFVEHLLCADLFPLSISYYGREADFLILKFKNSDCHAYKFVPTAPGSGHRRNTLCPQLRSQIFSRAPGKAFLFCRTSRGAQPVLWFQRERRTERKEKQGKHSASHVRAVTVSSLEKVQVARVSRSSSSTSIFLHPFSGFFFSFFLKPTFYHKRVKNRVRQRKLENNSSSLLISSPRNHVKP